MIAGVLFVVTSITLLFVQAPHSSPLILFSVILGPYCFQTMNSESPHQTTDVFGECQLQFPRVANESLGFPTIPRKRLQLS